MKTRITEMMGIQYPIVLSGMSWISVPKMVAAVSNAGGLGLLATGPLNSVQTRAAVKEIRKLTDKPFGANASLMFPGAADNAKVLLEERVPVINFALGKGDWIVKEAHKYGGKVVATVVNLHHAKRAQDYGSDAVIATGNEAAAHGEDVTSLVLIPHLAENLQIPVIAAGGFADGRGLAAALALGAEGIAMGTRLMTTKESPLHVNYKKLSMDKEVYDTIFSKRFDGHPLPGHENGCGQKGRQERSRPACGLLQLLRYCQTDPDSLFQTLPRRSGFGMGQCPAACLHGQCLQDDQGRDGTRRYGDGRPPRRSGAGFDP